MGGKACKHLTVAEAVWWAPAQRYAEGGTWAEEFAGGSAAAGDWADQFAAGLDGGDWAEQFAADAAAHAKDAAMEGSGVEVDAGAAGEYVFAPDNPFMQARAPTAFAKNAGSRNGVQQPRSSCHAAASSQPPA